MFRFATFSTNGDKVNFVPLFQENENALARNWPTLATSCSSPTFCRTSPSGEQQFLKNKLAFMERHST
jgi:hypothetical protein